MDEEFEKAWNKLINRLKKIINLSLKDSTYSVEFVKQTFVELFQKFVFPTIEKKYSIDKKVKIKQLVSDHIFFEPQSLPHDIENIHNGIIYFFACIIQFGIFNFAVNPSEEISNMKWFAILPAILCIYNFQKKSVGLAYVNQLDSIYKGIKRILEE